MQSKHVVDLRNTRSRASTPVATGAPVRKSAPSTRTIASRQRRRRLRIALAVVALIVLIIGSVGVHFLSYYPRFRVTTFVVSGASDTVNTSVEQFAQATRATSSARFISPDNIISYDPAGLAHALYAQFPNLSSVYIHRSNFLSPTALIDITERHFYASWCVSITECYGMDGTGTIYEAFPPGSSVEGLVFTGGLSTSSPILGQQLPSDKLSAIKALLTVLTANSIVPIGVSIQNDTDYFVTIGNGSYIKVMFSEDPQTVYQNLATVLSSDVITHATSSVQYIDLRFGDRVYYKLNTAVSLRSATTVPATSSVPAQ